MLITVKTLQNNRYNVECVESDTVSDLYTSLYIFDQIFGTNDGCPECLGIRFKAKAITKSWSWGS